MNHLIDQNMDFTSFHPGEMEVSDFHQLLLTSIAPRPIAFVSSMDKKGNVNLSPFSFFNVFSANPPLLIFSPARRVRGNTVKHTLQNVKGHPEVVINVVDYAMVEQMSLSSTDYEAGVNEFIKAGLTQLPSELVSVPRVGESPVSFECTVEQIIETGTEGGAGNLVICKVQVAHYRKNCLDDKGKADPLKLDLVARMGGNWYCRANTNAMFEIPKPGRKIGIGVDGLPQTARNSHVLTGNNLGRLGNMDREPGKDYISQLMAEYDSKGFLKTNRENLLEALHFEVQNLLNAGENEKALGVLWMADDLFT